MISPPISDAASASADRPSSEINSDADETLQAADDQSINARRALEEKIEILRRGRAL